MSHLSIIKKLRGDKTKRICKLLQVPDQVTFCIGSWGTRFQKHFKPLLININNVKLKVNKKQKNKFLCFEEKIV